MSASRIDHNALILDFGLILGFIRAFLQEGRGTRASLWEAFNAFLDTPYSKFGKTVPGLEEKLMIFRLACDVVGPGTTAEQGAEFSARFARVMSGHGAQDRQLNELHGLFVKHHGDWFIEQYNARLAA